MVDESWWEEFDCGKLQIDLDQLAADVRRNLRICEDAILNQDLTEPSGRPLDHWKGKILGVIRTRFVPEVKELHQIVFEIEDLAVSAVRDLRQWPNARIRSPHLLCMLADRLFAQYAVDPQKWWGPSNQLPPAYLNVLEFKWPKGSEAAQEALVQLRELLELPIAMFYSRRLEPMHPDYPTKGEIAAVTAALVTATDPLEQAVIRLRNALPSLNRAKRTTKANQKAVIIARIKALENELTQHLISVRDHAITTRDRTGTPELLPRPSQALLGESVGKTGSTVSRDLLRPEGKRLKELWEIALDIDRVMTFRR